MHETNYRFITSNNDPVDILHVSGSAPGIVFLGGLNTDGMLSVQPTGMSSLIGKYLLSRSAEAGNSFTFINWQAPSNGIVSQWRSNLKQAFNQAAQGKPQILIAHCFGAYMGSLLAKDLERNEEKQLISSMIFISPSFDGMRLAASVIGEEACAHIADKPDNAAKIPIDPPFMVQQRHLLDGENNLVLGDMQTPAPAIQTHIYHHVRGKNYVPIRVSKDYVAISQGFAVLEEIDHNRTFLTPGFLEKLWAKACAVSAPPTPPSIRSQSNPSLSR
jgi:predicted alpha/beta hydrolase family esterase